MLIFRYLFQIHLSKKIAEEGIDARLAAADADAAQIAEEDVKELLNIQGDINNFEQKTKSVIEITTNKDIEN